MGNNQGRYEGTTGSPQLSTNDLPLEKQEHRETGSQSVMATTLDQLHIEEYFNANELVAIRKHVTTLMDQNEEDPICIPRKDFFPIVGASEGLYFNRLYTIFDIHDTGCIDLNGLLKGLAILSQKASQEQKLLLSFHLLDINGDGKVTKEMTTAMLKACLKECKELNFTLNEDQIHQIVDSTFVEADLDGNNVIDFEEFKALDVKHPGLSDFLTIDALGMLTHLEKVQTVSR